MAEKGNGREAAKLCPSCGKRIGETGHAGSLTSYLFQPFNCTCSLAGQAGRPGPATGAANRADVLPQSGKAMFCPDCGLQKPTLGPVGAMTGFLFQNMRCKCAAIEPNADDEMARRFWKLRQTGTGSIFGSAAADAAGQRSRASLSIDLLPGAIIGGAYQIIQLIGSGGMGEVYLAKHTSLGKTCALKVIPPEQVTDNSWQRFQKEAKVIAGLDHINLVKVTDLGIHEGCLPFYAMEYVDGKTLAQLLKEHGPMPLKAVLDVFMQICDGVDYAHRKGIVHRDLKPANIMLVSAQGGNHVVKILDFGLVKLTQKDRREQSLTSVGEIFGSPFYMSPEQCNGDRLDNRSDIYSVGCTMFECLTGRPPFIGSLAVAIMYSHLEEDPPSLESILHKGKFPDSMEIVIAKLLRKNPVERYQTLLELRGDLEKIARGEDVQPFYLSRTKALDNIGDAARLPSLEAEPSAGIVPKGMGLVAALSLAIVAIVVAAILAIGGQVGKRALLKSSIELGRPVIDWPVIADNQHRKPVEQAATGPAAKPNDLLPFSSTVIENGLKYRIFDFPQDKSLGLIGAFGCDLVQARGKLKFAFDERVCFSPSVLACQQPSSFKRFRAGDIWQLTLPAPNFVEGTSSEDVLAAFADVGDIQRLNVIICDDLSNHSFATLEKFSSLIGLDIGANDMDPATIAKLTVIKQLESTRLARRDDITPVLKALRSATNLKFLDFSKAKSSLDGIAAIANLPRLEYLTLGTLLPSDPNNVRGAISLLSKAPELRELSIMTSPVCLNDLKLLARFKRLERLHLDRVVPTNANTTTEMLALLSRAPELRVLAVRLLPVQKNKMQSIKAFRSLESLQFEANSSNPSASEVQEELQVHPTSGVSNRAKPGWTNINIRTADPAHKALGLPWF